MAFARIPQVHERQHRVAQEHTWASVTHHGAHLLAHLRLVTVNGAVGAGWLTHTEGALLDALQSVLQQGGAIRAKLGRGVHTAVVHGDHHRNGALFTFEPTAACGHSVNSIIPETEAKNATPKSGGLRTARQSPAA